MSKYKTKNSLVTWHRDPECQWLGEGEVVEVVDDDELPTNATGCTSCTESLSAQELEKRVSEQTNLAQ